MEGNVKALKVKEANCLFRTLLLSMVINDGIYDTEIIDDLLEIDNDDDLLESDNDDEINEAEDDQTQKESLNKNPIASTSPKLTPATNTQINPQKQITRKLHIQTRGKIPISCADFTTMESVNN